MLFAAKYTMNATDVNIFITKTDSYASVINLGV